MDTLTRKPWRVIIEDAPRSGAWNMAVDRAIMEFAGNHKVPATLRIYQWRPPAVSIGKNQPGDVLYKEKMRIDGVSAVRRPTGGWAIFHTDELTYSVAAHSDEPALAGALMTAYVRISAALIAGLKHLGLNAQQAPQPKAEQKQDLVACFAVPYNNELTVDGKKLMGSAQARPLRKLLQHGSLPLTGDVGRAADYLMFTHEMEREKLRDHLRAHAATASECAGREITFEEAAAAMIQGFSEALPIELIQSSLSDEEIQYAQGILPTTSV